LAAGGLTATARISAHPCSRISRAPDVTAAILSQNFRQAVFRPLKAPKTPIGDQTAKTGTISWNYSRSFLKTYFRLVTKSPGDAIIETFRYSDKAPSKTMTIPAFHPEVAEQVATAFVKATAARWSFPRVDLQDRGTFMLISVDAMAPDVREVEMPLKKSIAQALSEVIPTHPTQKFGNWMVVFFHEGKMFETVHPSEFQG
jgi:hypothetical protein